MTLKERRESIGLSQSQLADKAEMSVRTLQDYEQGRKKIEKASGETIYKLSAALGCSMEDLISR